MYKKMEILYAGVPYFGLSKGSASKNEHPCNVYGPISFSFLIQNHFYSKNWDAWKTQSSIQRYEGFKFGEIFFLQIFPKYLSQTNNHLKSTNFDFCPYKISPYMIMISLILRLNSWLVNRNVSLPLVS